MSGVMLVSEDRELAKKVKIALSDSSARLTSVCTGSREATETFQQTAPELVVLETFLPESSGLDMLKVFKRMNEKCLFVMLSRLKTRSAIERAFRLGAHDVLLFPLDDEILRQTLLHRLKAQSLDVREEEDSETARKE